MYIKWMEQIEFTWDEVKRQQALRERAIDFADMGKFDWDNALTAEDARLEYSETRFISIGYMDENIVVCVWCFRDDTTRIISLRKANKRERKRYEQAP